MSRLARPLLVLATAVLGGLLVPAAPAQAHPMGNFSINQYADLTVRTGRVEVLALSDIAEIPTLQEKPLIDTDGNGQFSDAERAAYAAAECRRYADAFAVTADGHRLTWTVSDPGYRLAPGAGGLATGRLSCSFGAPASATTLRVDNRYRSGRVGWRELTAHGDGVRIDSALPVESVSGRLTSYPRDLLTSAPDVHTATIKVGGADVSGTPARLAAAGPSWLTAAQSRVESVVGGRLTPLVVGLAFLLALLLGAGHAALPGHGKTVMAAYFAGRRGRIRDALAVGGTVTLAHTGGVLLVGLLLSTSTALVGEQLLAWLGAASGLLVAAVGIAMLISARHARHHRHATHDHHHATHDHHHAAHDHGPDQHSHDQHSHHRGHKQGPRLGHEHGDEHDHGPNPNPGPRHDHGPNPGHEHDHNPGPEHDHGHRRRRVHEHAHGHGRSHEHHHRPGGRLGLAGIGLAGGLVPSPSALVVLLAAIGLGRAGLGVLLVLAYGIGMAGTLTAVGLLLVVAQRKLGHLVGAGRLTRLTSRVSAGAPTATAALVVLVGLGMGVRAVI
jgi:ABC-type nickel/cobalt efflux system permease component RcnA